MPSITGRTSIATGVTVANVLTGSQYEFAPFDGTMIIGMKADGNLVTCAIFAGPDTLQEPGGLVPIAAAEATPVYPDDYHWEDTVARGDRVKVSLTNGNAATRIINWSLRFTPA